MWKDIKKFLVAYLELLGDFCIIVLGGLFLYVFFTIEVFGRYGVEANAIIRRAEIFMGFPLIALGIYHLIKDIKNGKSV